MTRSFNWPTREEWAAKAEHAERTSCYTWQRVSNSPDTWLSDDELTEARALTVAIVKATRTALTRAGRANERPTLNEHGRDAAREWAEVSELSYDWGHITTLARSVDAAPEQVARLAGLAGQMIQRRDDAATTAEAAAIARTVAERNSDAGWAKELERRARIERGPLVTTITIEPDGSSTVRGTAPYKPPSL